jgi:hypothetical protein
MASAPSQAGVSALQPAAEPLLAGPAPLVPAAAAVTLGMTLDRWYEWPLPVSMLLLGVGIVLWAFAHVSRSKSLPLAYLALGGVAFGGALHHFRRDFYPPDDIGWHLPPEPAPVQLRGTIDEEPRVTPAPEPTRLLMNKRSG